MSSSYLFTSESVTEGHPDKVCDAISDAVLDAALAGDKYSRVACETLVKTGFVVIAGEITTKANIDFGKLARKAIKDIGYTSSDIGFDADTCGILIAVEPQSPDISQGVTEGQGLHKDQGAGDQGLMFGYACDETPELMPAPIMYAHQLSKQLAAVRKKGAVDFLRPDGKSQVTVEYENDVPKRIETVVVSTQHGPEVKHKALKEAIMELVIKKALPKHLLDSKTKYFVNPTGRFVVGGPCGDAGLTGRKNIVAAGLAKKCEVQVAYAIGVAQPMGVYVQTFGTGKLPDDTLAAYVMKNFDMRPRALIEELDLLRPVYQPTSSYGHFGRSEFTWENTSRSKKLAADLLGTSPKAGSNGAKATSVEAPAPAKAPAKKAKAKGKAQARA